MKGSVVDHSHLSVNYSNHLLVYQLSGVRLYGNERLRSMKEIELKVLNLWAPLRGPLPPIPSFNPT